MTEPVTPTENPGSTPTEASKNFMHSWTQRYDNASPILDPIVLLIQGAVVATSLEHGNFGLAASMGFAAVFTSIGVGMKINSWNKNK